MWAFYANVECSAGCKTGVLFSHPKKLPEGMKGIFVSFDAEDQGSYAVTLDTDGKILTREKLAPTPGLGVSGGLANEMGNLTPERLAIIMKMDFSSQAASCRRRTARPESSRHALPSRRMERSQHHFV